MNVVAVGATLSAAAVKVIFSLALVFPTVSSTSA